MSIREAQPDSPRCRWYQYTLRQLLVAVAVLSVLLSWYAWWDRTTSQFREKERQVVAAVKSLAKRRPPR